MNCLKCGYPIPDDSQFCQYCGVKIEYPAADGPSVQAEAEKCTYPPAVEAAVPVSQPAEETAGAVSSSAEEAAPVTQSAVEAAVPVSSSAEEAAVPVPSSVRETVGAVSPSAGEVAGSVSSSARETAGSAIHTDRGGQGPTALVSSGEVRDAGPYPEKKRRSKERFCKLCGGHIDRGTRRCESCGRQYFKFRPRVLVSVLAALIIVLLAGLNVYQYLTIRDNSSEIKQLDLTVDDLRDRLDTALKRVQSLNGKIDSLNGEIDSLKAAKEELASEKRQMSSAVAFYKYFVAIVQDNGTKIYHTYGCELLDFFSLDSWIYSTSKAEQLGYSACPKCH